MQKIAIDLRMINSSGIGTYIKNLIPEVLKTLLGFEFVLLGNSKELNRLAWTKYHNVKIIEFNSKIYSAGEQFFIPTKNIDDIRLYWTPHFNFPVFINNKKLVTIHDTFHLSYNRERQSILKKTYAKFMFKQVAAKASGIIFVSKFTQNEFFKLFGEPNCKYEVIHNGISSDWYNIKNLFNPHQAPYILFIGNIKSHKNLKNLLKAFRFLITQIPHNLIVLGQKEGLRTSDKEVDSLAQQMPGRVLFKGKVDQELLEQYLLHADALVFPSFYEGFGFPPLESMASGIPTICSNADAIKEVCGDAVVYFEPDNIQRIKDAILSTINNPQISMGLKERGIAQARQYTWDKCAIKTIKLLQSIL